MKTTASILALLALTTAADANMLEGMFKSFGGLGGGGGNSMAGLGGGVLNPSSLSNLGRGFNFLKGSKDATDVIAPSVVEGAAEGLASEFSMDVGSRISQAEAQECEKKLKETMNSFKKMFGAGLFDSFINMDQINGVMEEFHQCKKMTPPKGKRAGVISRRATSQSLRAGRIPDFNELLSELSGFDKKIAKQIKTQAADACKKATDYERQQCWNNKKKSCKLLEAMSGIMSGGGGLGSLTQIMEEFETFDRRQRAINNSKKNCKCISDTATTLIDSLSMRGGVKNGAIGNCVNELPKRVTNSLTQGASRKATWAVIKNPNKVAGGLIKGASAASKGGGGSNPLGALGSLAGGSGGNNPLGALSGLAGGSGGSNPLGALGGLTGGGNPLGNFGGFGKLLGGKR